MAEHGLSDWAFQFDRATKRFGVCSYTRRTIGLSKRLTLANSEEQCMDTVLHEIAHALVGYGHGHGPVWKRKAAEIGARPVACIQATEIVVVGNYKAYCAGCGPVPVASQDRRPTRLLACKKHREEIVWRDKHDQVVNLRDLPWQVTCPSCGVIGPIARKPKRPMRHNSCGNRVDITPSLGIFA